MNINPDALATFDHPDDEEDIHAGLPWNHYARFCGYPGMVWYSKSRKVRGDQLRVGDWLDTLDHRGARAICGISAGAAPGLLTVTIDGGETETIRTDVEYDVVDPNSQVTPDGTPVVGD